MGDEVFDRLTTEVQASPPVRPALHAVGAIAKVNYSHQAMSDMLIASPMISQDELARRFGYSPSWICQVLASDAFQAYHQKRLKEFVDPVLLSTVESNFEAMILRSQEILLNKLKQPDPPDALVLRSLELASRARGYGVKDPQSPVNVNVDLGNLANNLTDLLRRKKQEANTFDGESHVVSQDPA